MEYKTKTPRAEAGRRCQPRAQGATNSNRIIPHNTVVKVSHETIRFAGATSNAAGTTQQPIAA